MPDEISPNEYQRLALRTESQRHFLDFAAGKQTTEMVYPESSGLLGERVIHAMLGLTSEAGELTDALKRHLFYGKPLDRPNLKEEAGDLLWYIALLLDAAGYTMADAMVSNIKKLAVRYPDKFKASDALTRDLNAERAALDGGG